MGTRNDDISLILAKAKKQGFLPDVSDSEVDILSAEAQNMFSPDAIFGTVFRKNIGSTVVALGDSIESTASTLSDGASIFSLICILSNQKIRFLGNAGVPGNTTTQMLARIETDVIALKPDICLVGGPTNDHGANMTETETRANYTKIVSILRNNGITPLFRNAVPIDNANNYKIERHNLWLSHWCRAQSISILDYYTPSVDPLTGGPKTGYTDDGIHPNGVGREAIANYVVTRLPSYMQGFVHLTQSQVDDTNLVAGGTFAVDTNADGYADNWVLGGGTITPSLITDANIVGKWQQVSIATSSLGYIQQQITTGWAVGDKLAIGCLVDKPAGTSAAIKLAFSGGGSIQPLYDYSKALTGTIWAEGTVPAGTTTLFARLSVNLGAGSVKVARFTVLNLTALGLA